MKALALALALGGTMLAAAPAMAQQASGGTGNTPGTHSAPPAETEHSGLARISSQDAQQLAQEQQLQSALNNLPGNVKTAAENAAKNGQLIGIAQDTWSQSNNTTYRALIEKDGTLFKVEIASDGKVIGWMPKLKE